MNLKGGIELSNDPLRIAVFSDMHFMAWKDTNLPVEWVPQLANSLKDAVALAPDLVVMNGDLTNGKVRDYELAMRHMNENIHVPTFFTMGNHEYYGYYEDEDYSFEMAQRRFMEHTGQKSIYYSETTAEASLLFLSPECYKPDEFGDAAWLSKSQLAWFEETLLAAPANKPVLIFLHQPIDDTVANSTGYCVSSPEMRQILAKRRGCFVISGHTHCRMDRADQFVIQDGTVYVGGGCCCNDVAQSRWFDVHEDHISIRIRNHNTRDWEGDEFSYRVNLNAGAAVV